MPSDHFFRSIGTLIVSNNCPAAQNEYHKIAAHGAYGATMNLRCYCRGVGLHYATPAAQITPSCFTWNQKTIYRCHCLPHALKEVAPARAPPSGRAHGEEKDHHLPVSLLVTCSHNASIRHVPSDIVCNNIHARDYYNEGHVSMSILRIC